ncbi:MAG TPA: L-histidine N(alpha)-methyltransferase [Flavobacteriales bacterium]|nr:L-histidine N(alpha)-methyltransferase [Flavobacteriales bacterium]
MILSETCVDLVGGAVKTGLEKFPKSLPSWLFYDEKGDAIFQAIMKMPEYYLTGCEFEIFESHKNDLLNDFAGNQNPFKLVELGAGDGLKTEILLKHFVSKFASFSYYPIDVSGNVLEQLEERLSRSVPKLKVNSIRGQYETGLHKISKMPAERIVYMFLGANIGNFSIQKANEFTGQLAGAMHENDLLVIGFDLKKDPNTILAAYNDKTGITRDFNLNLLVRFNRELRANFDITRFYHYPTYDPATGTTKSYLISKEKQTVFIEALDQTFSFEKGEYIHTEISQKFDMSMIAEIAAKNGLEIVNCYYDSRKYFVDVVFRKK